MEQLRLLVQLLPWVVALVAVGMAFKMEDKYSKSLLAIMSSLIISGLFILTSGYFIFGFILLAPGVMMISGIKTPKSPPKTIFLITFFGKPTESISEGLTLTLTNDWFDVVGTIEVPVELKDEKIIVPEEIRCHDDVPVGGSVTIGFIVNLEDGAPRNSGGPRTRGQKVLAYVKSGQAKGVMDIIRGAVIMVIKEIARDNNSKWMETMSDEIGKKIIEKLEEGIPNGGEGIVTAFDLGINVAKLTPAITAPQKVRDARSDIAVEEAQRASQLADTETMNQRVLLRMSKTYSEIKLDADRKFIGDIPEKLRGEDFHVVFARVRAQLIEEQALNDGKYQFIGNKGGINVVNTTSQQGSTP